MVNHNEAYRTAIEQVLEPNRGDGGFVNYYAIPEGATELDHLIKHKKMTHGIGEIFCAVYRLNDTGEYERNLGKIKRYIDLELEWLEKQKGK